MKMSARSVVGPLSVVVAGLCALSAQLPVAAADPYAATPTYDNAVFAIADGYTEKQIGCTPDLAPSFESITWNPPGFTPEGGSGMINDANPSLGGPFVATWAGDHWDIEYQYC